MDEKPFVVLKFLSTEKDPQEYVEVGLRKWLIGELDDEMHGRTYWPSQNKYATQYAKTEVSHGRDWNVFQVEVKRFYDTFLNARRGASQFTEDSNYETEVELGRGRRKRNPPPRITSSSSDSDEPALKLSKKIAPSPPSISADKSGRKNEPPTIKVSEKKGPVMKPLRRQEAKKAEREEVMKRLASGRKVLEKKLQGPSFECSNGASTSAAVTVTPAKTPPPAQKTFHTSPFTPQQFESSTPILVSPNWSVHMASEDEKSEHQNMESTVRSSEKIPSTPGSSSARLRHMSPTGSDDVVRRRLQFTSKTSKESKMESRLDSVERLSRKNNVVLGEMSSKLDILIMNQGRVLSKLFPGERRISSPTDMPALPLNSEKALNDFENFLKTDLHFAAVADYMGNYIRKNVTDPEKKSATNILKNMITNKLASTMNLDGGNKKISFRSLNLNRALQGALQTAFPASDLSSYEEALGNWLKDAKWRKDPAKSPCKRRSSNSGAGSSSTKNAHTSVKNKKNAKSPSKQLAHPVAA